MQQPSSHSEHSTVISFRDLGEFRLNNDSILSDMKLKDKLIKDLQFKLEHNEGCEYFTSFYSQTSISFKISMKNIFIFAKFFHEDKKKIIKLSFSHLRLKLYSLCLVIVMRTTADDNDGGSSSTSCVVDSLIENESRDTVGVNNCVNISSNSFDATSIDDNEFLLSDQLAVTDDDHGGCVAAELDEARSTDDDEVMNKFLIKDYDDDDDDDALTSSKYSDVTDHCEMLQPSTSTSTARPNENVVASRYASTRDNNRKHQKAVRKNFSLWIGVTSCVWGLLLLLMKNYAD